MYKRKSGGASLNGPDAADKIKGVVYDSGETLLIFELKSQTNTPLPSVLLQTRASNAQH